MHTHTHTHTHKNTHTQTHTFVYTIIGGGMIFHKASGDMHTLYSNAYVHQSNVQRNPYV